MLNVLLLKIIEQGRSTDAFLTDARAAFQRRGDNVNIVEVSENDIPAFERTLSGLGRIDIAYSFASLAGSQAINGQSVLKILQIPQIIQFVDYPITYGNTLLSIDPSAAVLFLDMAHADAVRTATSPDHFAYLGFNPMGATVPPAPRPESLGQFVADRDIPIVFIGALMYPDNPYWINLPPDIRRVLYHAVDVAQDNAFTSPQQALDHVLQSMGGDLADPDLLPLRRLSHMIQEWQRKYRRFELLKAAERVKLPLSVYGRDYDSFRYRFPSLDFRGELPLDDSAKIMRRSRIVLNHNANFNQGAHDRVFSAMASGAVALSDTSFYYDRQFEEGRNILLFDWRKVDEHFNSVRNLLEKPETLFEIAQAGHDAWQADHQWDNRILNIIEAARQATLRLVNGPDKEAAA